MSKLKSQMYPWVDKTVNPIRGRCPHDCSYCYVKTSRVKHLYQGKPYLVDSFFEKSLGKGKTIFMGSCFDLFADGISRYWIQAILLYCRAYPTNTYLFQSKNPLKMSRYKDHFPPKTIFGTTIESNRDTYNISKAPQCKDRVAYIALLPSPMISLEPLLDFDLKEFVEDLKYIEPSFISIGADSKNHHLPEPPAGKIKELIQELEKFTAVKIKPNLKRLMK